MTGSVPGTLPERDVEAMFDRIARFYDRVNSVMTAGLHHSWRRRAAQLTALGPGERALDVATGTGDLAFEVGHRVAPGGAVVGVDFSEEMLRLARLKAARRAEITSSPVDVSITFARGDAMALAFEDSSFDAATVGFGARNFADLRRGLHEMTRVVRPGGKVVVLEITTPTKPPLSHFFEIWFDRVVPILGRATGNADAYAYLPSSVRRFPAPEALAAMMHDVGLEPVSYIVTAGGIIALHVGEVRK